jgi:hypothetical protein
MAFIAFTAMTLAAEEAAALAAQQLALEVAAQEATKLALQEATQQAVQQGITQAATSGIEQAATPGLEQLGTQGIDSVVPGQPLTPAGQTPVQTMTDPVSGQPFEVRQPVMNQTEVDQMTKIMADNAGPNSAYKSVGSPTAQVTTSDVPITQTLNQPSNVVGRGIGNGLPPTQPPVPAQPSYGLQSLNQPPVNLSPSGSLNTYNGSQLTADVLKPQPSPLENGWNSVTKFMKDNPMTSAIGAYGILNATGALKPQNTSFGPETYTGGPLANYRLAPNFQTYPTGPNTNIYRPKYAAAGGIMQAGGIVERMSDMNQFNMNNPNYPMASIQMANGGITSFAKGGSSYNPAEADYYTKMMNQPITMPAPSRGDAGVFIDSNPNTRRLNAPDAALYYQKALANRYGINTAANLPKGAMGKINTVPVMAKQKKGAADDVEAAAGGIMQAQRYNLGGYAHGGNPRLLRGPGDGMSDNIPATIADSQPARLADGEFVVPADVVSGLGNGSTEAGAKQLHKMMDEIRMARTGKKAQGKQINPSKYMPK